MQSPSPSQGMNLKNLTGSELSPEQLSIELTTACNYKCRHCATTIPGYVGRTMKKSAAFAIIDEVATFQKHPLNVRLFGQGEVCILPWLPEYINYITEKLPTSRILVLTNGSKLDVMAQTFVRSNVRRIFLSVEGGTQQVHENIRGKGSFFQLVKGLQALKREKKIANKVTPSMDFTTVLTRESIFDLKNLVQLAIRFGADTVKTQALVPHTELDLMPFRLATLTPEEKLRALEVLREAEALAKANNIVFAHLSSGDPFNEPEPFCNKTQKSVGTPGRSEPKTVATHFPSVEGSKETVSTEAPAPIKRFKNCVEPWKEAWVSVSMGMLTCERRRFDVENHVDKVPLKKLWQESTGLNQVRSNLMNGTLDATCAECVLRPSSDRPPVLSPGLFHPNK